VIVMEDITQTKDVAQSQNKDISPEDLIRRYKEKQKIKDNTWTQCILRDILLYKCYKFREKKIGSGKFNYIQAFTSDNNPKDVFESVKSGNSDAFVKEGWESSSDGDFNRDGVIKYNGKEYEYKEQLKTVASISKSPDTDYRKNIELEKIDISPLRIYNSLNDKIDRRVLVGSSLLSGMFFRSKIDNKKGSPTTYTKRSKILTLGFLTCFLSGIIVSIILSIMNIVLATILMAIFMTSVFTISISYAYNKTPYLYSANDREWVDIISEDLAIRSLKKDGLVQDEFTLVEADLNAYNNGDITIEDNTEFGSTWTFKGNKDGTPSKEGRKIIKNSQYQRGSESKEFAIAEKTPILDAKPEEFYESDDGKYILTTKSEYRDLIN
jgi:hypothetical protein